ncbi:hypothetical protein K7Z46_22255, partial [Mycobacterium avium subsp. hominissuis]|uniref:hypothetical protein n=1 Tax=Mycobacterium avium TaxID=1764 RepID=UPI00293B466F
GIRDPEMSRGLGDLYKSQALNAAVVSVVGLALVLSAKPTTDTTAAFRAAKSVPLVQPDIGIPPLMFSTTVSHSRLASYRRRRPRPPRKGP